MDLYHSPKTKGLMGKVTTYLALVPTTPLETTLVGTKRLSILSFYIFERLILNL